MSVKYKGQTIAGRTIAYLPDADVYSTEETVVGQWIDGKPIYRKVVLGTSVDGLNVTSSGVVDKLLSQNGYWEYGSNHYVPFSWYHNTTNKFYLYVINNDVTLSASSQGNKAFSAIIEYTKTTDTATIAIPTAAEMTAAYAEGVQSA